MLEPPAAMETPAKTAEGPYSVPDRRRLRRPRAWPTIGRLPETPMRRTILAAVLALAAPLLAAAAAPSFDCARAGSKAEQAICRSPKLAALDRDLGAAYRARLAREPAIQPQQRAWLKARDAGCEGDAACLTAFLKARLAWLSSSRPMPAAVPRREGECALTSLKRKTHRFEDEPDSGSAAEFANGGSQVSYETVPPLERSRAGDAMLFCLVMIPDECPPGDERGKVYAAADLRTLEAWALSDSEHSCGGA